MVVGFEVGESGTPHLQGYVEFKNQCKLSTLKRWLPSAHFEVAKGTAEDNLKYCTKDNSTGLAPIIRGTPELAAKKVSRADVVARYEDAYNCAVIGNLDAIPKDLLARFEQHYRRVMVMSRIVVDLPPGHKHDWFVGSSGTGKSKTARESYPNAYLKGARTKWWDGYDGQEVVIIEDLDRRDADYMVYNLKIWLDMYKFPAEIKGGSLGVIRPKHIVITSNWSPQDLWQDPRDLEPILRRLHCLQFPLPLNLNYTPLKF